MTNQKKLLELEEKLAKYEKQLSEAMIGYRGLVHESAVSEIKHTKVMVLRAIVEELKQEISVLKKK